jgi:hypothetical protein
MVVINENGNKLTKINFVYDEYQSNDNVAEPDCIVDNISFENQSIKIPYKDTNKDKHLCIDLVEQDDEIDNSTEKKLDSSIKRVVKINED